VKLALSGIITNNVYEYLEWKTQNWSIIPNLSILRIFLLLNSW